MDNMPNGEDDPSWIQALRVFGAQTVEERIAVLAACASINSLALGYSVGCTAAIAPLIKRAFDLSVVELVVFEAAIPLFAVVGALVASYVAEPIGRRRAFFIGALFFLIGSIIEAFSPSYAILLVGTAIVGIGNGFGTSIDPMYIAEVSPKNLRGYYVTWAEIAICAGQLLGFCCGLFFTVILETGDFAWRGIVLSGALPSLPLLFAVVYILPESPRWLARHARVDEARAVFEGVGLPASETKLILADIQEDLDGEVPQSYEQLFRDTVWFSTGAPGDVQRGRAMRRMLLVGVGVAAAQQLSGIDAIFNVFLFTAEDAGIKRLSVQYSCLVIVGLIKLCCALYAAKVIDFQGRRPLLMGSLIGVVCSLVFTSLAWLVLNGMARQICFLGGVFAYTAAFELGIGPGCWLLPSEVFQNSIRARATAIATMGNRLTSGVLILTSLPLQGVVGWSGFFLFFASTSLLALCFMAKYLPETRGKSLEETYQHFLQVTRGEGHAALITSADTSVL